MMSLGFYDLMNIAEQNSEQTEREASKLKFPSYKSSKNKKEDTKSKALSVSVQKFLAKKEEEQRQKEEDERIKKERLLELRSKDKNSKRRVNQMLRMTKSSNKAVMADAAQSFNDSLVDQHGELQPDDDDYGFVSQESIAMHKKILEKYKTIKKSTPLPQPQHVQNVPVPEVKALKGAGHDSSSSASQSRGAEKKKVKNPQPALSYMDLLALADEKKDKPPVLAVKKASDKRSEEEFEFGRPMTEKEKKEYLAEKLLRERVARQVENGTFRSKPAAPTIKPDSNNSSKRVEFKIPKSKSSQAVEKRPLTSTSLPGKSSSQTNHSSRERESPVPKQKPCPPPPPIKEKEQQRVLPKPSVPLNPYMDHVPLLDSSKSSNSSRKPDSNRDIRISESAKARPSNGSHRPARSSPPPGPVKKSKLLPNENQRIPVSKPVKSREPHPSERRSNQEIRAESLRKDDRRPQPHSQDERRKPRHPEPMPKKGRQVIDSDEEDYDSEMEDFIDDSECDPNTISAMIRKITGYDKRRYRPEDEGECMETSAYDQMREESRSLRLGIQEDLEDMRLEEEEKKRKLQRQQQLKRKQRV